VIAHCRQKLVEVNQSKDLELTDLRQQLSTIEQQLADTNIVSSACSLLWSFITSFA